MVISSANGARILRIRVADEYRVITRSKMGNHLNGAFAKRTFGNEKRTFGNEKSLAVLFTGPNARR